MVLPGLNFVTWVGLAVYAAMCDRGKELAEAYKPCVTKAIRSQASVPLATCQCSLMGILGM